MCDTFVALSGATADGSVIVGKNSDREPGEAHELVMFAGGSTDAGQVRATYISVPQVERTHAVILAKPYWMWGAEMGVNEHGLAIGNEAVFTSAPREKHPGLLGMDLLRIALERAMDVDGAVEVITTHLERYGQGGVSGHTSRLQYDNSFLISDRNGATVLETVGRDWAIRRIAGTASISNRLTIDTPDRASAGLRNGRVRDRSDFLYTRFSDSAKRQCRTSDALDQSRGAFTVSAAFALLRDHGDVDADWSPSTGLTGQTVCAHAAFGPIRVAQATGSMVAHITTDDITVWLTGTSAPCTSIFKPVWFDGGLPVEPRPGKTFDPAALWWRHELLHREVLCNYPLRMAPLAAGRDALQREFLAEASAAIDRAAVTARCFDRADAAEQDWLRAARSVPPARLPTLYSRAWRHWNRQAGIP